MALSLGEPADGTGGLAPAGEPGTARGVSMLGFDGWKRKRRRERGRVKIAVDIED